MKTNTTTQTATKVKAVKPKPKKAPSPVEVSQYSLEELERIQHEVEMQLIYLRVQQKEAEEKAAAEKEKAKTMALEESRLSVRDLLNQIVMKLKNVKIYNSSLPSTNEVENYLGAIKGFSQRALDSQFQAINTENLYYSSDCS